MHHIYHTEGLILGNRNFGEAGKYYQIFTRDLGMITASAQGVRKLSSKLRFVLQDFSHLKIDLVRGKDFWRITSASKTNVLEGITKKPSAFRILFNVSRLLKRLLSGEEPNQELFDDFVLGFAILQKTSTRDDPSGIEAVIVLRILANLGYIGEEEAFENLIKSPFEEELVYEAAKNKKNILREINKALRETNL